MNTQYPGQGYQPAPGPDSKPPAQAYPPPVQAYQPPAQAYPPPAQAYPPNPSQPGRSYSPNPQPGYQPGYQPSPPSYAYAQAPPYAQAPMPQTVNTSNTVVVSTQPTVTTVVTRAPSEDHTVKAVVALVLSIIGLCLCGGSFILLTCLVPAFILAIMALVSPRESGASSTSNISIGLSLFVGICFIVGIVIFGIAYGVLTATSYARVRSYTSYSNCYSYVSGGYYRYSC